MTKSFFDSIIGNDQIKTHLDSMIKKGRIPNSLLFSGEEGIGKALFAEALAKTLLCKEDPEGVVLNKIATGNHPDVRVLSPEGKLGLYGVNTIRQFSKEVQISPYESEYKIFILNDADRMLPVSANALLKSFEEPAVTSIIILLSSKPENLLETILSRCQMVRFQKIEEEKIAQFLLNKCGKTEEQAKRGALLSQGSVARALSMKDKEENSMQKTLLQVLSVGGFVNFESFQGCIKSLHDSIEKKRKLCEKEMYNFLKTRFNEKLSAVDKKKLEKEIDGAVSMEVQSHVEAVLNDILFWYRDLQLLLFRGNRRHLFFREYEAELERVVQRGGITELAKVEKWTSEAKLAFVRSIPFSNCLESLFLKLSLY